MLLNKTHYISPPSNPFSINSLMKHPERCSVRNHSKILDSLWESLSGQLTANHSPYMFVPNNLPLKKNHSQIAKNM